MIHAFNNPILTEDVDEGFTMFVGPRSRRKSPGNWRDRLGQRPNHRPRDEGMSEVLEVNTMPRSAQEILDRADALAARFERHEPDGHEVRDAGALRLVREAFQRRADAERRLTDAVVAARSDGHSWAAIGAMVGTSGEAARQRYGQPITSR